MRRSLFAVLASLAALWTGVAAATALADSPSPDADTHAAAPERLAAVAPIVTAVAGRDSEHKTGPLFALAVLLTAATLAAIRPRRAAGAVVVLLPTRVVARGWSRRAPPRHLVIA
jgi:hypothetical protein